jgi:acyl-[acyl-carrier-protein]-phospholipid O-acyltransferase/long-chain-fatty-acid--[acyl-carrier-protein] ligase
LQKRSPKEVKGGMIAASNFVTFSGMTVAALLFMGLFNYLGFSPDSIFLIAGAAALIVSLAAAWILRHQMMRFIAMRLVSSVYKQNVLDHENVPAEGGALIVSNHVSYADAAILMAATERPVRFLMYKGIYDKFWMKPLAKFIGAIPVMAKADPEETANALQAASDAINAGELVVIFAEGSITRTGRMTEFKRGLERIMMNARGPIVPVRLEGLWGSVFSFSKGRFFKKLPMKFPYPISVRYGNPMSAACTSAQVQRAVEQLECLETA